MSKKVQGQIRVKGNTSVYIDGRISGIIDGVICDTNRKRYARISIGYDEALFRFDCTERQFNKICKLIETFYSNMYEIEFLKV